GKRNFIRIRYINRIIYSFSIYTSLAIFPRPIKQLQAIIGCNSTITTTRPLLMNGSHNFVTRPGVILLVR
ncbi:MAG: hypothetical protein V3R68_01360, partial [Gammaproteobacteria bacterium]